MRFEIGPSAPAMLLQESMIVPIGDQRLHDCLMITWANDIAAFSLTHEGRGFTLLWSDENHRTPRCQDPVDLAGHAEPAHLRLERDEMDVSSRETEPQRLIRLIGEEPDVRPFFLLCHTLQKAHMGAVSDHAHREVREDMGTAEEVLNRLNLMHDAQIPRIHQDKALVESLLGYEGIVPPIDGKNLRSVCPVWNRREVPAGESFLHELLLHAP